jgi:hypothetical protein
MRAHHRPKTASKKPLSNRSSDSRIVSLTQRLIAADNPDEASELATTLVNTIREHIDRLRQRTAKLPDSSLPEDTRS